MRVSLFVTCLVDQCRPEVGLAAVKLLERAGCEVVFDQAQTCCGQPAFNAGYRSQARAAARCFIEVFEATDADAIVAPSGSCVAMARHLVDLFEGEDDWQERARRLAARTHELSQFLVHELHVEDLGARFSGRVTWHDACHGLRDLGLREEPRRLLQRVEGLELIEHEGAEACCGFGGTFSVGYPEISVAIADEKIAAIHRSGVDAVVSSDLSCLLQIGGRLQRLGSDIAALHLAELLAGGF